MLRGRGVPSRPGSSTLSGSLSTSTMPSGVRTAAAGSARPRARRRWPASAGRRAPRRPAQAATPAPRAREIWVRHEVESRPDACRTARADVCSTPSTSTRSRSSSGLRVGHRPPKGRPQHEHRQREDNCARDAPCAGSVKPRRRRSPIVVGQFRETECLARVSARVRLIELDLSLVGHVPSESFGKPTSCVSASIRRHGRRRTRGGTSRMSANTSSASRRRQR